MVKNLPTVERSTKIRFGKNVVEDQAENTIIFNASNTDLQATNPGAVYLSPIRFREDFSDPQIVLLMYNKTTGEITESGSSASTAVEPPLSSVTGFGNTTPYTIEFNNPTTAFTAAGNVHITGDLEIQGNVQFRNGDITEIKNTDLVVEDRIIGIANNNTQTGLDVGIIMNYPNQNVGIIHHGDENPKRLSIGYTQNTSTDVSITPDANTITLDVLGHLRVQNDTVMNGQLTINAINATTGTFSGDVSGAAGTFTGAVSGASITDGTGTLSGGAWSGSAATLTTARTIGGVAFNGSTDIDLPGVNIAGTQNTTGTAAGLTTAVNIGGVSFDGTSSISLPGVDATGNQNTTGSAATLTTARAIGGVAFNGSSDIDLPGVNLGGNQNTTGSAATLTTARLIGGVAFDGSANIDLPGVNLGGNQNTTGSAATLTTARTIGGVAFDGSADIVPTTFGNISAGNGTFTGTVSGVDGTFSGDVSGVAGTFSGAVQGASYTGGAISGTTGTFSGTLSSAGFTATSAQINGVLNTTGNLTVNTDAIIVDATNKRVGVGKTPGANIDVLGNVYASGAITSAAGGITATTGLITGDGGGLSNLQVSSFASDLTLGTDTSGDYVASLVGGDGITAGAAAESATPTVAVDLKTGGGLVIETGQVAVDLAASSITGTLAVADGGTGVTTSTGTTNVVLSDSPTLTGTLTAATANFSGDISAVAGTFTGAVQGASYTGGPISGTTGNLSGVLTVTDSTQSTSTSTGSVIISGGVGIAGVVHSSNISAAYDQDLTSYVGRAALGYMGESNHASFAHIDNNNTTSYSVKQTEGGTTHLNAKSGQHIRLSINNSEKARLTGDGNFYVDTNILYVDAVNDRVGIGTSSPAADRQLDVVGNVHASGSLTVNRATVTDGMIINAGGVTKKFYSFNGTITDTTTPANAAIKLTFSSNIFYAKIVAHLVEDSTEFSNMSLEVGGGSRAGGATPQLKLGAVSVFGNTSTNPWNSTPDVTTTAGAIIIQPSANINSGGGSSTAAALYNIFVEYISPDAANGKLVDIYQGASQVKTFNY